jgi:DNA mismatch repair protein MutL
MDGPSSESVHPSAPDRGSACQEQNVVSEAMRSYLVRPAPDVIPLGQINRTFLVAQVGTELHVIDQHTAHERVLFERFSRAWADRSITVQPLLIPETVEVPPHAVALLETHIEDLAKLGVEIEPFGRESFVVRGVPALLGRIDHAGLVHDLIEDLEQWHATSSLEAKLRPLMATLSCHSAVRAGRAMALPEIKGLIENWIEEGLPTTCPHGRRVALRLPAEELAKIFGR